MARIIGTGTKYFQPWKKSDLDLCGVKSEVFARMLTGLLDVDMKYLTNIAAIVTTSHVYLSHRCPSSRIVQPTSTLG